MDGFGWTVTGGQLLAVLGVLLVVVLVAVAGRVLLAAAVIVGTQWTVITYWAQNTTLVWVVLVVPALLAGYTLATHWPVVPGWAVVRIVVGGVPADEHRDER